MTAWIHGGNASGDQHLVRGEPSWRIGQLFLENNLITQMLEFSHRLGLVETLVAFNAIFGHSLGRIRKENGHLMLHSALARREKFVDIHNIALGDART